MARVGVIDVVIYSIIKPWFNMIKTKDICMTPYTNSRMTEETPSLEQYIDQNSSVIELTLQPQSSEAYPGDALTSTMVHLDVTEKATKQCDAELRDEALISGFMLIDTA